MIRTDAELKTAQKRLAKKQDTLRNQREELKKIGLSEEEIEKAIAPLASRRDQLHEKIETFHRMRRGNLSALHDLRNIGSWLIGARIAKGWSLSDLANALEVSVQQVSRDENDEYQSITVKRAQRVLDALGVQFSLELDEPILGSDRNGTGGPTRDSSNTTE